MSDSPTHSKRAGLGPFVLEMVFIFVGVSAAFLLDNYRDRREGAARAVLLASAIHQDITDNERVETQLVAAIDSGLATYDAGVADGRHPVPYVLEISGSLRPPAGVWESAGAVGLKDFADPALLFELSSYYSEQQGIADNFVRYTEFTEREFWPLALSDTLRFYQQDGRLRGQFKAHLQQLRDYRSDLRHLIEWGVSLQERLRSEFPRIAVTRPRVSPYGSVVRVR